MKKKKGFTLIEMLVVVLIIGILAGIALPQYRKAVEKAKLSEALINIKNIEGSMQRYILTNGYPSERLLVNDFSDINLSGGIWDEEGEIYKTKDFSYEFACFIYGCGGYITRLPYQYTLYMERYADSYVHGCYTCNTEIGQYICKYLESQDWVYHEGEV